MTYFFPKIFLQILEASSIYPPLPLYPSTIFHNLAGALTPNILEIWWPKLAPKVQII